jgi:uncharacterized membrane protein
VTKKRATGVILIFIGICLILLSLPFTSEFDRKDHIIHNIIRNFMTGEIILRESVIELVPDREESLYREFQEYISKDSEIKNLSEVEAMKKFYEEHYKNKMYQNEFRLKMNKKKIITHRSKIAIPYKYISLSGVLLFFIGMWMVLMKSKKRGSE